MYSLLFYHPLRVFNGRFMKIKYERFSIFQDLWRFPDALAKITNGYIDDDDGCWWLNVLVTSLVTSLTKLAFSNNLKVDQTCLLAHDHKFRRKIEWTKLGISEQVPNVILNSFKHFSGPKFKTLGIYSAFTSTFFQWAEPLINRTL